MLVGLVHHFDALGRERRIQLFRDDVAPGHGGAIARAMPGGQRSACAKSA
jgi:hypothetical protein